MKCPMQPSIALMILGLADSHGMDVSLLLCSSLVAYLHAVFVWDASWIPSDLVKPRSGEYSAGESDLLEGFEFVVVCLAS